MKFRLLNLLQLRWVFVVPVIAATVLIGSTAIADDAETTDPPPAAQPDFAPALGPAGQEPPFNFNIPMKVDHPGPTVDYGTYRLIPYGFAEALSYKEHPVPDGTPVAVQGLDSVKDSPLRTEPSYVPDGYRLSDARGIKVGNEVVAVALIYEGPSFPIMVARRIVSREPVDIYLHPDDAHLSIGPGEVAGLKAIFQQAKPGDKFQVPISVRVIKDGVEFVVGWRVSSPENSASEFDELLKIAESYLQ